MQEKGKNKKVDVRNTRFHCRLGVGISLVSLTRNDRFQFPHVIPTQKWSFQINFNYGNSFFFALKLIIRADISSFRFWGFFVAVIWIFLLFNFRVLSILSFLLITWFHQSTFFLAPFVLFFLITPWISTLLVSTDANHFAHIFSHTRSLFHFFRWNSSSRNVYVDYSKIIHKTREPEYFCRKDVVSWVNASPLLLRTYNTVQKFEKRLDLLSKKFTSNGKKKLIKKWVF